MPSTPMVNKIIPPNPKIAVINADHPGRFIPSIFVAITYKAISVETIETRKPNINAAYKGATENDAIPLINSL